MVINFVLFVRMFKQQIKEGFLYCWLLVTTKKQKTYDFLIAGVRRGQ